MADELPDDLVPVNTGTPNSSALPADLEPVHPAVVDRLASHKPIDPTSIIKLGVNRNPVPSEGDGVAGSIPAPSAEGGGILMNQAPTSATGNFLSSAVQPFTDTLPKLLLRAGAAAGVLDKGQVQNAVQNTVLPADTSRTSGILGSGVGQAAEAIGSGPAAPYLFMAQGAEQATEGIESRARQGQTASQSGQIADVVGQGLLQYAMGKLAPGQKLNNALLQGMLPELKGVAANLTLRAATSAGVHIGEAEIANIAGNALTKYTGVNQDQNLTEGAGAAALQGGVFGGLGQVGEDLLHGAPATSADPTSSHQPVYDVETVARLAKEHGLPTDFASTPEPPAPAPETGPSMAEDFPTIFSEEDAAQARNVRDFKQQVGDFTFENPTEEEMASADARVKGVDSRMGEVDRRASMETAAPDSTPQDFGYEFKSPADVAKEGVSAPAEHADARSAAEWASQYDPDVKESGDPKFAEATTNYFEGELKKLKGGDGKFVLADVPTDAISPNGSYQPDREQQHAELPPESRPPGIMGFDKDSGEGVVVDGNTRLHAAIANGEKTIRAYVPEESIGMKGITRAGEEAPAAAPDNRTPFQRRALGDEVSEGLKSAIGSVKDAWTNANRVLGTGLGVDKQEAGVRSRLISTGSELDLGRTNLEQALKPARDYADTLSESDRAKWTDAVEKGQDSPDPKLQPATDLIRNVNKILKSEATKAGIDTDNWNGDWIGRLAEWPDSGKGRGTSLSGPETYLKGRKLDSFSDFKAAVEKTGGRLKYDNPVDMYLAKAAEVHRSVAGRQFLNNEEGLGTVKTFDTANKIPDGWKQIDDKLAQGKTRLWVDRGTEDEPRLPGEEKARMKPGTVKAAPAPIADMLNQFIAPGLQSGSLLDQISKVTRAATAVNFSLSAFHAATTAYSNAYLGIRQAMDNVMHGEFSQAVTNTGRALNPVASFKLGSAVREQLADVNSHPELEPLAKAIKVSGAKSGTPTILERSDWQKAINAYRQGDRATAGFRFGKAALGAMSDTIMHKLVPNMKVAALAMAAETATKRGLQGRRLARYMQEASRLTDNTAGQVIRSNQFQHRVVQNVMDLVMTAPKFAEGAVRIYGGATVDTLKGLADVVQGKSLRITGNQQMVLAHLLVHAAASAATQAIVTSATTGQPSVPSSLKDLWYPKTGRKNADGSDERLTLPDPLGAVASAVTEGPTAAIKNRVNPLWKAISDVATNSDYRDVRVREGNVAQQIGQSAKHIGAAVLPWSIQQASQPDNPNQAKVTPAQRAAAFAGVRVASPRVSDTPAQQLASQLIANHYEVGSRSQEEAAKSDEVRRVSNNIRSRQPGAVQDIGQDVRTGKLNPDDIKKVVNRAGAPEGLVGTLKTSKLNPDEIMQVWDKASLDEKKNIRLIVQKRVAGSGELSVEQKRTYLQKIFSDVRPQEAR